MANESIIEMKQIDLKTSDEQIDSPGAGRMARSTISKEENPILAEDTRQSAGCNTMMQGVKVEEET